MLVIVAIGTFLSKSMAETQGEFGSIVASMDALQQWDCCPEFIDIGDEKGSVRLQKRGDLYAIRGSVSKSMLEDVEMRLTGDGVGILRGTPSSRRSVQAEDRS